MVIVGIAAVDFVESTKILFDTINRNEFASNAYLMRLNYSSHSYSSGG